jgi:hypothetical protein
MGKHSYISAEQNLTLICCKHNKYAHKKTLWRCFIEICCSNIKENKIVSINNDIFRQHLVKYPTI